MKKFFALLFLGAMTLGTVAGVSAAEGGWNYGPDNSLSCQWWTGWNINGDYTETHARNTGYEKRAYARSGGEGKWSDWGSKVTFDTHIKDMGPYGTNQYDADATYR